MQNKWGALPNSGLVHRGLSPGGQTGIMAGPGAIATDGAGIGPVGNNGTGAVLAVVGGEPGAHAQRATVESSSKEDLIARMCYRPAKISRQSIVQNVLLANYVRDQPPKPL
jgi:hypothetical protein